MRILITGGAGFQGSHLAEFWLNAGHNVTILNTYSEEALRNIEALADSVRVVWGSVTDAEIVEKTLRDQDVVVHLAARISVDESISAPRSFLQVNVEGTYNILEGIRQSGARLIYGSSCEVYGSHSQGAISEHSELNPHSPYAASKAAADRLCFAYYKTYDSNVTIARPSNIYGERQRSGRSGAVIPIFLDRALAGQPLGLFGDGTQSREYLNIDDLVQAYNLILNRTDLVGETINLGSGSIASVGEIAEFVAGELGASIEYRPGRSGEVEGFHLDSTKARGLGFEPKVPFWEGLTRYIRWRQQLATSR